MEKNWIIVGFILFLAISSLVLIFGYQPMNNIPQNMDESWMFKGAYASYEGQIDSLSTPYNLTETIQVTDLNDTYVQIQTNSSIATSFAPTLSDQTIFWFNRTNIDFRPEGMKPEGTLNTKITLRSIGSRDCTAYDYTTQAINATYYIDKTILWPIRIIYSTTFENQTYQMEFNLVETNIEELN